MDKLSSRLETIGAKITNLEKKHSSSSSIGSFDMENVFLALQIFSDRLYSLKINNAKYVQIGLEQNCMKVPVAFLIKKMRESPRFIQRQKSFQKSIETKSTNPTLYEQELTDICNYVGTAIDRMITPLCNFNLGGFVDEDLIMDGLNYFDTGFDRSSYAGTKKECGKEPSGIHFRDYSTREITNKYYSTLQLGGGKKNNNATKKRNNIYCKMRTNIHNKKIPRSIYEIGNVTRKRMLVHEKFQKNVRNVTLKKPKGSQRPKCAQ
jgi:hypothetical protein